jgi:hypothetical protein
MAKQKHGIDVHFANAKMHGIDVHGYMEETWRRI